MVEKILNLSLYLLQQGGVGGEVAAAVEVAVADGLHDVLGSDALAAGEVGDGAGNLEDAVVGAGAHVGAGHHVAQAIEALRIRLGKPVQHRAGHLGVAVHALVGGKTLGLHLAGGNHAGADGGAWLATLAVGDVVEVDRLHLNLQVDAVEQRSADLAHVLRALVVGAHTLLVWVAVVAAGARVHRGHEHKRGRVFGGIFRPGDADHAVLEWLSHHLEHAARELGQLVEEEHAVVCQRDLTGCGVRATAHESHSACIRLCGGMKSVLLGDTQWLSIVFVVLRILWPWVMRRTVACYRWHQGVCDEPLWQ